jgi:Tetratricopeptide repeat
MTGSFFVLLALATAVPVWAQQGSGANSGAGTAPQPSASQSSAAQNGGATPAPSEPRQPVSGTSDDLRFPEDDPAPAAPSPSSSSKPSPLTPPRSDRLRVEDLGPGVGESSSKDTPVDLSAPEDDAKVHPQSSKAIANAEAETLSNGITEFHTFDPHKAAKDVEVGDFYFKRGNYHGAEERYRDALHYKENDAIATIRLAVCLEKLGILDDARSEYESYLKILPHGPQAQQAQKAVERLKTETSPR